MSNPQTWSDRRGIFQKGKEVHEGAAARRASTASEPESGVVDALRRASVGSTDSAASATAAANPVPAPNEQPRRISNAGLFSTLSTAKRGTQDYTQRRASHTEQMPATGGVLSGWYRSTFQGMNNKPTDKAAPADQKRGVME